MEEKLDNIPEILERTDGAVEDIIAKIINLETNKCGRIPSSSTAAILSSLKAGAVEEVRRRNRRHSDVVPDQHLD